MKCSAQQLLTWCADETGALHGRCNLEVLVHVAAVPVVRDAVDVDAA